MPRKKPLEVDEVHNPTVGVRVKIMLDREKNIFYATFAGKRVEHEVCGEVIKQVREAIVAAQQLEWIPIIQIEKLMPFSADTPENFIGFSLHRFYLAYTTEGRIVQTRWFEDDGVAVPLSVYRKKIESRAKGANESNDMAFVETFTWDEEGWGKFQLPYPYEGCSGSKGEEDWRKERTFYVRFTPELWQGLELIQERIEEMRRRLDELLLSPEGHKLIAGWVSQLSLSGAAFALATGGEDEGSN